VSKKGQTYSKLRADTAKGAENEFVPCSCLKFRTLRNVIMQQRKFLGKSVSSGRPVQLDAAAITAIL